MKAFITGAAGFVGGHLKSHLQSSGDEVISRDSANFDIRNFAQILKELTEIKPEVIYHLAGLSFVPECESNFSKALEVNVNGTENVLRAAREACPDAVVIIVSSGEVYGAVEPAKLPFTELHDTNPVNNYSLSKVFAERLAIRARNVFKQKTVIMRPFNHIGPGQSTRFVVASFAEQLALMKRGQKDAVMHVGNLAAKRDLTDVRDIVRGYRLAALKGEGLYNLCSGTPVSIQSILDLLIKISGLEVKVQVDPSGLRATDTAESRGSYEKAKSVLGWSPQIPLEQSLKDCYEALL